MIPLPDEWDGRADQKGWHFKVLKRIGDAVLVEKTHKEVSKPHYEVAVVKKNQLRVIAGVEIPAKESLPSSEQWGQSGWTYSELGEALDKVDLLANALTQN
jgi:hypothetical protein